MVWKRALSVGICAIMVMMLADLESLFGFTGVPRLMRDWLEDVIKFDDEEVGMTIENIIEKHGYPHEVHEIETADGYILTMFRIPKGKAEEDGDQSRGRSREPVLINHAFASSALDYFVLTPDALPFLYADAGFDVWLGNFRGNQFATKHRHFLPDSLQFWNFTLDHLALYDVPAQIDYILNATSKHQLAYFGYSMGGGSVLQMLSLLPEYNHKIRKITLVSPSGYYGNSQTILINNAIPVPTMQRLSETFFNGKIILINTHSLLPFLCRLSSKACFYPLQLLAEYNPGQISLKSLVRIYRNFPQFTSVRAYIQVLQSFRSKALAMFDYGQEQNIASYGASTPPVYNYSSIQVPICALLALRDNVVHLEDGLKTLEPIPSWCNRKNYLIDHDNWAHLDSLYGKDAAKLVFQRSLKFHLQENQRCSC